MWRFITVTFAFLGWSFYILSGGSEYEPRLQSIQARAKLDDVRPLARPVNVDVAVLDAHIAKPENTPENANGVDDVTRALSSLDDLGLTQDDRILVTLAAVEAADVVRPEFETDPLKTDALIQPQVIAPAGDTSEIAQPEAPKDIRRVTGDVVNVRDGPSTYFLAIGKLTRDTEVEVVGASDDGWLNIRVLDTQQEGWMADWLVSAAN